MALVVTATSTLTNSLPLRPSNFTSKFRTRISARISTDASQPSSPPTSPTLTQSFPGKPEADVVVIGSGIGGLCCGALLARYDQDVLVLESHDLPGGAAHSFTIKDYKFDSGPSLFSGFQSKGLQANPLAQVLDALEESLPCVTYDSWMVYIPEGEFLSRIGPTEFFKDLQTYAGPNAEQEWRKLLDAILPLSAAAMALPPLSIRGDLGVLSTAGARYAPSLFKSFLQMGPKGALGATKLLRPFVEILDSLELKDPFIRNWVDLLSFLLAGVKSDGVLSAEMIYMFSEWYKPGCCLEYPLHGSGAVIDALVRGLKKFNGRLSLRSHVESIIVEDGRAIGVKLRSGQFVRARKAVVSNASMWDTLNLLPKEVIPQTYKERIETTPQCESFMHLHLGFDAEGAPDPYWRYGGGGSARPSSSERGNIPKTAFPGYLSSETSTLPNYNSYNSIDRQTSSSDLFHKDILPSRSGAYGIDSLPSVRAEPSISGLVSGASYKDYTSSFEDPNQLVHGREAALGQTPGIPDILPSHSGAYGIGGMSSVRAEPSVSGLVAGSSYKGYSFSFEDPNLPVHHRDVALGRTLGIPDILPSHAGAYGIDGMPSVRDEPIISGLVAGASYKGYPSSSDASNQLVHGRDVASGRTPGIPDLGYDRPNSMSRTDGNPAPVAESNVLFIDGLPTDCTRREIGHLFRPFIGFRDVRVIHKERRRRGDKASVLCFVEFTDTKCAGTAMEALQGYKFDHKKPDSPILRIHFAHFPFRLPSDQKHPQLGHSR